MSETSIRRMDDSDYIIVDLKLNKGGLQSYTLTHINDDVRFSGYIVGIADRESYCSIVGIDLPEVLY